MKRMPCLYIRLTVIFAGLITLMNTTGCVSTKSTGNRDGLNNFTSAEMNTIDDAKLRNLQFSISNDLHFVIDRGRRGESGFSEFGGLGKHRINTKNR